MFERLCCHKAQSFGEHGLLKVQGESVPWHFLTQSTQPSKNEGQAFAKILAFFFAILASSRFIL